jgi:transcriptional regulator GlxA family with amidase domain
MTESAKMLTPNVHVNRAIRLMQSNLPDAADMGWLARRLHISIRLLHRVFEKHLGISPRRACLLLRLRRARDLLADPDQDLTRIAEDLGFAHLSHF